MPRSLTMLMFLCLTACGGGSGDGGGPGPSSGTPVTVGPSQPSGPSEQDYSDAALMLDLTTFGPTYAEVELVAAQGVAAYLNSQFQQPLGLHEPIVRRYIQEYGAELDNGPPSPVLYRRFAFFEQALTAEDQLRQLTAYALTQIFVVSQTGPLQNNPLALSNYYDTLLTHSFGNFRDLLLAVTLHPAMGFYLSHVNNAKTDLEANTFPDENYAREVMQLFTIGLFELNPDGTQKLDGAGRPIPTYDNDDIQEFAKIFTGLSYGSTPYSESLFFGKNRPALDTPMVMFDDFHEPGEKYLLNGLVVPAGQTGMEDVEMAVDNLFNHPNTGPFIGRQLIQRLVTSNPSPEYVARVAAAFADDGSGQRGNMETLLRAILTDPEVAQASRVREPFRRFLAANRSLHAAPEDNVTYGGTGNLAEALTGQFVLHAPSVFNFYSPFYRPPGGQGAISPEMQITNEDTAVGVINLMASILYSRQSIRSAQTLPEITIDLSEFEALVTDTSGFLQRAERLFFAGSMPQSTRQIVSNALSQAAALPALDRAKLALYLSLISPEQAATGGES